jgi:hypothetical protein
MNALTIHIYSKDVAGRQEQVLSIFVANHNVTLQEFDESVVNAITATTVTVDTVHIVGYQEDVHRQQYCSHCKTNVWVWGGIY